MKKSLLLVVLGLISASIFALPPPGDGDGGDPDTVPIDGGISLLIAAGAAYGGSKFLKKKKEA